MTSKTTIEVNGKLYDAVSGAIIGTGTAPSVRTGKNIDGFFRGRTKTASGSIHPADPSKISVLAAPAAPAPKPKKANRSINHAVAHKTQVSDLSQSRVKSGIAHSTKLTVHRSLSAPNHAKHRTTQNSVTLMRSAVKRPSPSFHKQAHTVASLQHVVPSLIVPKKAAVSMDSDRLARAQASGRSIQITHHSSDHHQAITTQVLPLAVRQEPVKPHEQVPAHAPAPKQDNRPGDMFEHALANATHFVDTKAHKAIFKKKTRLHFSSMAAGTLALVVIAGFAAYQNTPGVQFRVAGIRAGVTTSMPNFAAAGFAYKGVQPKGDKVMIGFSNASGNYELTQQATNLSESDMIHSIGATDASGAPQYTTIDTGDTNVYRFSNTSATWVKDGVWYSVTGDKAISNDQIKSLVQNS